MVLPPQPFVSIDLFRDMNLMTGPTKLSRSMKRLQKSFFVKSRLCLDELAVYPLQHRLWTRSERVMDWLVDCVVGISTGTVNVADAMADSAGYTGVSRRVVYVIEVGIIEPSAKEGHRVVATGAPS